ncbi:MAG: SpoIIE family protein phosphatase [Opitutaceae bacterium]|nr:SpoIIE family protein phosphatase [Opitutaceae bacterium]
MTTMAVQRTSCIEWSVASRALPGEASSGDLHLVTPARAGVLVAVVDGLGHGVEATAAAQIAVNLLHEHAGESVIALAQHCHRGLRETRGVVMTLMTIEPDESRVMTLGIGNVETMLFRANPRVQPQRLGVLLRGGVVGYQLPALHASVWPISVDDVVVFATDGLREDFGDGVNPADSVVQVVDRVMAQKFRGTDDGLVLACKYLGRP